MRFFLFFYLFSASTTYIKQIEVVDAETKKPIPFVSYSRLSDRKGSFANELGVIEFPKDSNQAYIISCVGYKSDTILLPKIGSQLLLHPKSIELQNIDVVAKRIKKTLIEIGYLSKFSLVPYWDGLTKKIEICTFIPSPNKEANFGIGQIKIDIGADKSEIYKAYQIRLFIKSNDNKNPGKDLLTKDVVVQIKANTYKLIYSLEETILLPKEGCFVGFQTVGKINKSNHFLPFTDFSEKAPAFQLSMKLVNSNSFSKVKFGSFDWMTMKYTNNHPDTYAIGLDIYPIERNVR